MAFTAEARFAAQSARVGKSRAERIEDLKPHIGNDTFDWRISGRGERALRFRIADIDEGLFTAYVIPNRDDRPEEIVDLGDLVYAPIKVREPKTLEEVNQGPLLSKEDFEDLRDPMSFTEDEQEAMDFPVIELVKRRARKNGGKRVKEMLAEVEVTEADIEDLLS